MEPNELDEVEQRINDVICAITGAPRARDGQIRAVRRLVYLGEDTVLIAATGYGKSAFCTPSRRLLASSPSRSCPSRR